MLINDEDENDETRKVNKVFKMFKTSKSATSNQHQLKSCPRFFLVKPTTTIILTLLFTSLIQFSITPERAYGQTTSRRAASAQDASAQDIELIPLLPKGSENSSTQKPATASSSQGQGLAGAEAKTPNNTLINLPSAVPAAATTTPPKPVERPASPPAGTHTASSVASSSSGSFPRPQPESKGFFQGLKDRLGLRSSGEAPRPWTHEEAIKKQDERTAHDDYARARVDRKQAKLNTAQAAAERESQQLEAKKTKIKEMEAERDEQRTKKQYSRAALIDKEIEKQNKSLKPDEESLKKKTQEVERQQQALNKYKKEKGLDMGTSPDERERNKTLTLDNTTKKADARTARDTSLRNAELDANQAEAKRKADAKYDKTFREASDADNTNREAKAKHAETKSTADQVLKNVKAGNDTAAKDRDAAHLEADMARANDGKGSVRRSIDSTFGKSPVTPDSLTSSSAS
ncbi:hypothetical protein EBS43_08315, partial [bacterium]|nr:hypothetical protein [bacterium]